MVNVQGDISDSAYATICFTLPLRKKSLLSGNSGWRYYPISLHLSYDGNHTKLITEIDFTYSSTCPCSAALSRQLLNKFQNSFNHTDSISKSDITSWLAQEENIGGLPHAQRSVAKISLNYGTTKNTPLSKKS